MLILRMVCCSGYFTISEFVFTPTIVFILYMFLLLFCSYGADKSGCDNNALAVSRSSSIHHFMLCMYVLLSTKSCCWARCSNNTFSDHSFFRKKVIFYQFDWSMFLCSLLNFTFFFLVFGQTCCLSLQASVLE